MTDHIVTRHRWLLGQLRDIVTAYEDFADRAEQGGETGDAGIYQRVSERVQNLLNKRDLKGTPVPKIGVSCKITEETPHEKGHS